MADVADPRSFDERIESLTAALDASADAGARDLAKELVALVLEFHRAGLSRIVAALAANRDAKTRLVDDPIVRSLLALHELDLGPDAPLIQISRPHATSEPTRAFGEADHVARCAQCGAPLATDHNHLVDLESRRLSCSCRACWLLAGSDDATRTQRRVPHRYRRGPDLLLTDAHWDALQVPVDVAFFMKHSIAGRAMAFYPSPAGPTESALTLDAWQQLAVANPWVAAIEADVEALLVRKERGTGLRSCFIVPIDACYELVGRLRLTYGGLSGGGADAGDVVDRFFGELAARCTVCA